MARKKKGDGFVLPALVGGAKGVAAAVLNASLRPVREGFPAAEALIGLDAHGCRWPIGDTRAANFRFCGVRQELKSSYCGEHEIRARGQK